MAEEEEEGAMATAIRFLPSGDILGGYKDKSK
jgi:hypothetical protein